MELSDTPAYGVNGALTYEGAIARIEELEQALRAAQHDLTTTEGLTCADGLRAYGDALADGCDPNGAWDTFREQT